MYMRYAVSHYSNIVALSLINLYILSLLAVIILIRLRLDDVEIFHNPTIFTPSNQARVV